MSACGQDENPSNDNQHNIISQFTPIINGTWVLTDYIDALTKTQSPKEASAVLKNVVVMQIDPTEMEGDTVFVSSSMNNHKSFTFYLFMRLGQDNQSLQTELTNDERESFFELSYNTDTDTTLLLKEYDKDKKLISSKSFAKVTGPQNQDSQPYGIAYMANKILFAGKYTLTDETDGSRKIIELTPDGLVKGMGIHSTYFVFTDFMEEVETNLDEMLFDENTRNQKGYIFEINADTIRLYKALENEERTLLIRGEHRYTLMRQ